MEWKLHLFKLYNHIACLSSSVWFMFPLLLWIIQIIARFSCIMQLKIYKR
jgi:hypothetical protein